jgi:hypothetical protein
LTQVEAALVVGGMVLLVLGAGMILSVLRRSPPEDGPLPDVPDAPWPAAPVDAPGLSPSYSSLDPFAPPKRRWEPEPADRDGSR